MMKSPFHHIKHPEGLFEHFHKKIHHAFAIFALAMIGMLWGASNILTHTSASWQWGGFITSDFWTQSPSDGNIKYALYGDGTPGSTAYTRLWTGSCIPTSVVYLPTNFTGGTGQPNTIYILSGGTYTLINPITIGGDCSAIIGKGDVIIKSTGLPTTLIASGNNQIIVDNIKFNGQSTSTGGMLLWNTFNTTLNNVDVYSYTQNGISLNGYNINLSNSHLYSANVALSITYGDYYTINNSLFYNNIGAAVSAFLTDTITINNSQFLNNDVGVSYFDIGGGIINNSIFYNNNNGASFNRSNITLNNAMLYNNITGLWIRSMILPPWFYYYSHTTGYGTTKLFGNTTDIFVETGSSFQLGTTPPIASRSAGTLETGSLSMSNDRITNPQNGSGQWLINGTNRSLLRGAQTFDTSKRPIRYIFGGNILKQIMPVWYNGPTLTEYGNNGTDYITTRYIAEPDSTLPLDQQALINQYFGSGSIYTQNWQTNGCSLSAFQVRTLDPGTFNATNNTFEDHTIYILTGGQYVSSVSSGFVLNGNCIALIGNSNTHFTKSWSNITSVLYANNKRNIILDNIKVDAKYFNNGYGWFSTDAQSAIKFDGASNNSTINNVQAYNATIYGIYLGLSSHHNTIINTQAFNNGSAGIHLYYASNYNVINNTQTYNNAGYGIWFANGSNRNTMNNFQAYNNAVGVFGDLTTQENILNRAAIYNNSDAGIYFKNASGNSLNDVRIYHNTIGIKSLYSSMGNKYYGDLRLFDNTSNFDGTNGVDTNLSAGTAGIFPYAGTLNTGGGIMTCLDATNPLLSGFGVSLINTNGTCSLMGYSGNFISPDNTYINYEFGLNMYKQKIPVRYNSGNTLVQIPSQYDATKYIAEIFAIRDNTPEGMNFASSGAAQLNTWYATNVYTATVLNIAVPVTLTLTGGSNTTGYLTISGVNVGLTGIVNNGDTIKINLLTRTGYNETVTGSITVGSANTGFTVTTRGLSTTPTTGSFAFANLTSVPVSVFTGSSTIIAGIETGVLASITFAPVTTSGRLEVYSGATLLRIGTTGVNVVNGNQVKVVAQSSSGYGQTITGYVTIGLGTGMFTITNKGSDLIPPTTPSITYPLTGEELFFVTFEWNASVDSGSGLEGYVYQIAEDTNFIDIINTGFIYTVTGTIGSPSTGFDVNNGRYYWRIQAKDRDGNYSPRSNTGYFNVVEFTNRNFTSKTNANLRTYYDSNEITLEGIKPGLTIWARTNNNGTLYKNGSDKGTGVVVQNGDKLYITSRSSNMYDRTITTTLTLANRILEFNVTTKQQSDSSCTVSDDDKTTIQSIFDSLVQSYTGDANKFDEFLYTMQSMLADEIDFTNDCNLQYLEDLISLEVGSGTGSINTGSHIAPNCKEYPVSFDTVKAGYTSPTFKVVTYFANRDSLARYIDSKNPGDCHINSYGTTSWTFTNNDPSKHTASNGKMYTIQSNTQGYTSTEFSVARYFSTLGALRNFIDSNNIPQAIRSHQVDTSFTPQIYTAPNTKQYTIYKTDRGYMSYKLMKVRYFSTLSEIQSFISKNNSK